MSYNFKEIMSRPERLAPGHRMCAGCGGTIAARNVLRALHPGDHAVIGNATGCMEVSTFMYPYTAWQDSYIHNAFENAGATISGVEGAYNVLKRKGKLKEDETFKFITFGGDGGTYDIGFQSLSGAVERNHDFVYVCYDNGAYMNTGIQRSSATPMYADTTTTPVGSQSNGKPQNRKDLTNILVEHDIPYAAQTTCETAAKKAMDFGLREVNVFVKGPGVGRESAIRTLGVLGLKVRTIRDVTPIPHNGCRPRKTRRV